MTVNPATLPPTSVDEFDAGLRAKAQPLGVSLDILRFAVLLINAGGLLPAVPALAGDAAMIVRAGPKAADRSDLVPDVWFTSERQPAVTLEEFASALAAGKSGIAGSIEAAPRPDGALAGTVTVTYLGSPWCSFGCVSAG